MPSPIKSEGIIQHQYPDFRIKAPLMSTSPLKADIGVKEGVSENTMFEVLERVISESAEASFDATEFEIVSGRDFAPGMLIREK